MQTVLRDSAMFCWNVTFIMFLTLVTALAVMPPSGREFLVVCYLAGLWSACFMYAMFVTGWSHSTLDIAAPRDQTIFLSDLSQINNGRSRHHLTVAIQLIQEFMEEESMKAAAMKEAAMEEVASKAAAMKEAAMKEAAMKEAAMKEAA